LHLAENVANIARDWNGKIIAPEMSTMKRYYKKVRLIWFLILIGLLCLPGLPVIAETLPKKAYVPGVVGHRQSYSLSCESSSASDLAAFWNVSISERKFLRKLPRSDNPEKGFVGKPSAPWGSIPPNSYGVHAIPVAQGLSQLGLAAEAHYGMSWNELRREIAAGRPVMVWVIGQMWLGTGVNYQARDGQIVRVAHFEHTMIVIGYDVDRVYVVDAYTGLNQSYTLKTFKNSWNVLGRMAVTVTGRKTTENQPTIPDRPFRVHLAVLAQKSITSPDQKTDAYRPTR
jgi:uncharacterized protein YvpB